jgi:hypothetical protein
MVDQEARKRIEALEARGVQRDREIADLSGRLSRLAATLEAIRIEAPGARVAAAVAPPPKSAVSSTPASRSPASASPSPAAVALPPALKAPDPRPPAPSPSQPPPAPPSAVPAVGFASSSPPAVKVPPPRAGFASLIVADFPALFAEFRRKRFTLLWRGSRDGFGAGEFHGRCDYHANTLMLILDTEGNIFGGFTPVEWESVPHPGKVKADPSLKSFLFTLKNPHNFPAKKFALKTERKDAAIYCGSSWGPHFCNIGVKDNCNADTSNFTDSFGGTYANDTGRDGSTFFTGSPRFTVKEIEVFEITD